MGIQTDIETIIIGTQIIIIETIITEITTTVEELLTIIHIEETAPLILVTETPQLAEEQVL